SATDACGHEGPGADSHGARPFLSPRLFWPRPDLRQGREAAQKVTDLCAWARAPYPVVRPGNEKALPTTGRASTSATAISLRQDFGEFPNAVGPESVNQALDRADVLDADAAVPPCDLRGAGRRH